LISTNIDEVPEYDIPAAEFINAELAYNNENINHELAAVDFAEINTIFAEKPENRDVKPDQIFPETPSQSPVPSPQEIKTANINKKIQSEFLASN
jgi:hypothetical protein